MESIAKFQDSTTIYYRFQQTTNRMALKSKVLQLSTVVFHQRTKRKASHSPQQTFGHSHQSQTDLGCRNQTDQFFLCCAMVSQQHCWFLGNSSHSVNQWPRQQLVHLLSCVCVYPPLVAQTLTGELSGLTDDGDLSVHRLCQSPLFPMLQFLVCMALEQHKRL